MEDAKQAVVSIIVYYSIMISNFQAKYPWNAHVETNKIDYKNIMLSFACISHGFAKIGNVCPF